MSKNWTAVIQFTSTDGWGQFKRDKAGLVAALGSFRLKPDGFAFDGDNAKATFIFEAQSLIAAHKLAEEIHTDLGKSVAVPNVELRDLVLNTQLT